MGINAIVLAEAREPLTLERARHWTRMLRRAVPIWTSPLRYGRFADEDDPEGTVKEKGLVVAHATGAGPSPWLRMYTGEWHPTDAERDGGERYVPVDWRRVVEVNTWLRAHPTGDAVAICAVAEAAEHLIGPVWYGTDASEAVWRFPESARRRMLEEKWTADFTDLGEHDSVSPCKGCGSPIYLADYGICLSCGVCAYDGKQTNYFPRDDQLPIPDLTQRSTGERVAWFRALGARLREVVGKGPGAAVADAAETYAEEIPK